MPVEVSNSKRDSRACLSLKTPCIAHGRRHSAAMLSTCACHCRVDTLAVSPVAFVGRELRLLWPDDDAWFLGTAADFDAASGMHKVELPSLASAPGILLTCGHPRVAFTTCHSQVTTMCRSYMRTARRQKNSCAGSGCACACSLARRCLRRQWRRLLLWPLPFRCAHHNGYVIDAPSPALDPMPQAQHALRCHAHAHGRRPRHIFQHRVHIQHWECRQLQPGSGVQRPRHCSSGQPLLPSTMPHWCSRVRMQPQQLLLSSRQPQAHHHNQHSSMRQQLQPQMV